MGAVDPTYPLYPIACMFAAVALLSVLLSSFIRQNWNLGVTFLCLWLFFENLTNGVDAIIWSDNAEVKLYVYCDIVSHLKVITYVAKPMATFIITRRLYLIASLQVVEFPSDALRRRNCFLEWILGFIIPLLIAGPICEHSPYPNMSCSASNPSLQDYVHQGGRFEVYEGFGCSDVLQTSILEILTIKSWTIVPPTVSVVFYYRASPGKCLQIELIVTRGSTLARVVRLFYRRSQDLDSFLQINKSISRTNYLRILALASIDLLLTLPINIVATALNLTSSLEQAPLPFYWGWNFLHSDWGPVRSHPYAEIKAGGTSDVAQFYFTQWTSPVLAFTIFGLFGATRETRASYWRILCRVGVWVGWAPTTCVRKRRVSIDDIEFGAQPQCESSGDVEMRTGSRRPSVVASEMPAAKLNVEPSLYVNDVDAPKYESKYASFRSSVDTREVEHGVSVDVQVMGVAV
ncbi:STE3-domain-containing protein [Peniophora sp. CONT]|nr:STE3-domain-containing protein [Peniophora sp. CONT]